MTTTTFDPVHDAYVQEMGHDMTSLGYVLYIKIRRFDEKPMSWREVWEVFSDRYPGYWAVQFFPPASELVDDANIYHLYVLHEPPSINLSIHS